MTEKETCLASNKLHFMGIACTGQQTQLNLDDFVGAKCHCLCALPDGR